MTQSPVFLMAALATLAVLVVLTIGIGGFARGGQFNRRNGNRLMRWRIILQAVALALILLFIWLRDHF